MKYTKSEDEMRMKFDFIEKTRFIISQAVADIEDDEIVKSVEVTMKGAPIVSFKDGTRAVLSWKEIIKGAKQAKEDL